MGTKSVIEQTKTPNTTKSLVSELNKLGLHAGDTVIIHSSLKSIGWVVGGSIAVIDALMEVITTDGTIVMPTHTAANTDPKGWENPPVPKEWHDTIRNNYPPYRPELTPSYAVGLIPEVFRKYQDVIRSSHPIVSFAAWGRNATFITENHKVEFGLGNGSPIEKIYNLDGKILLLGVGHDSNTSIHLAEDRAVYPSKKYSSQGSLILRNGERNRVEWEELELDTEDFIKIGGDFDYGVNQEYLKKGKIGNADAIIINQRNLVDFAVTWMEKYRA